MKHIGLVLVQGSPVVAHDPLISGIEHGLEESLVAAGMRPITRVVRDAAAELDVYRFWQANSLVDAVILVRIRKDDQRVALLDQLAVPFTAVVDRTEVGKFAAVALDSMAMMRSLVEFLASGGHSTIVYVSGPAEVELSSIRARAFRDVAAELGVEARVNVSELTAEAARRATASELAHERPPSAVIYDDDVTAVEGLRTIKAAGLRVPEDVAVVAWIDSVRCQSAVPPITALSNEAHRIGLLAGTSVIQTIETGQSVTCVAPDSFIVERASTRGSRRSLLATATPTPTYANS